MTITERIMKVLEEAARYLTFDELYHKIQPDCDWVLFAGVLENLVEQGKVQYTLPYGLDTGYYGIAKRGFISTLFWKPYKISVKAGMKAGIHTISDCIRWIAHDLKGFVANIRVSMIAKEIKQLEHRKFKDYYHCINTCLKMDRELSKIHPNLYYYNSHHLKYPGTENDLEDAQLDIHKILEVLIKLHAVDSEFVAGEYLLQKNFVLPEECLGLDKEE